MIVFFFAWNVHRDKSVVFESENGYKKKKKMREKENEAIFILF